MVKTTIKLTLVGVVMVVVALTSGTLANVAMRHWLMETTKQDEYGFSAVRYIGLTADRLDYSVHFETGKEQLKLTNYSFRWPFVRGTSYTSIQYEEECGCVTAYHSTDDRGRSTLFKHKEYYSMENVRHGTRTREIISVADGKQLMAEAEEKLVKVRERFDSHIQPED